MVVSNELCTSAAVIAVSAHFIGMQNNGNVNEVFIKSITMISCAARSLGLFLVNILVSRLQSLLNRILGQWGSSQHVVGVTNVALDMVR